MSLDDDQVFEITKLIYDQMKSNYDQNHLEDQNQMVTFKRNYIQPLYPSKRCDQQVENSMRTSQHNQNIQIKNCNLNQNQKQIQNDASEEQDSGIKRYSFKQLCCFLGVGDFFCWKTKKPDPVYEDLGLGMCLYLKFMKHLVYCLLILSILPILQMCFYYTISSGNGYGPTDNYQKTFFSLTIGTLSLESIKCLHQDLDGAGPYQFDLICAAGHVRVLGPVYSDNSATSLRTCRVDINHFVSKSSTYFINSSSYLSNTNCNGQISNCTYNITLSSKPPSRTSLSISYECTGGKSQFGSTPLSRSTALIYSIIFDLIFIVGIVIFYWSQTTAQQKQQKWFNSKQLQLDSFTIQVGYFRTDKFQQDFKVFLDGLQQKMKEINNISVKLRDNIAQIRLPDNQQFISDQKKRRKIFYKLYKLMGLTFFDSKTDPHKCTGPNDFKNTCFSKPKLYSQYKSNLSSFLVQYHASQSLVGKNVPKQIKVFLVFSKPKYKRFTMQYCTISRGRRFLSIQDKEYRVYDPPAPALVLWSNIGKNRVIRNIISWTVSLAILGATYVFIAFILYERNHILENYNFNIQCHTIYPGNNFKTFDETLYQVNPESYIHCYCLSTAVLSISTDEHCKDWSVQYSLYLAIPLLFSLVIVIINAIISAIYKALSKFQAHQYLTTQLYSYIIKKTTLLVMNLAVIIIVLSIDVHQSSNEFNFLFQGYYDDLTADWYLQVGLIVTFTLIFNLFGPFTEFLLYFITSTIRKIQLWFYKRQKNQFKKTKFRLIQIYRNDQFMIEERYSVVLAILWIVLCLNCVFPIMTLILILTLFLLELSDKILLIRAFQKPVNLGSQLHKNVMRTFLAILLFHFIVTALLLTQPFLLQVGNTNLDGSILNVNHNRIQALFETPYVLPYIILFFLVLSSSIIQGISMLCLSAKPNRKCDLGLDGIPFDEHKFHKLLNKYELNRTIELKKRQIKRIKAYQKGYLVPNQQEEENDNIVQSGVNILLSMLKMNSKNAINLNPSFSILNYITELNYSKLKQRHQQNIKDKERLVKLTGMTVYEWKQDWIFFDQAANDNYSIQKLDQHLRKNKINCSEFKKDNIFKKLLFRQQKSQSNEQIKAYRSDENEIPEKI